MQLDAVIDAARDLKAQGLPVSQNRILERIGGSKRDIVALWPDVLTALGEPVPVAGPTLQERLSEAKATRQAAQTRWGVLRQLSLVQVLSPMEELEQVQLEQRAKNLGPIIDTLEKQLFKQQAKADIDGAEAAWNALVPAKHDAYAAFVAAVGQLGEAFEAILALHDQQEAVLARLPRPLHQRLAFPDRQSARMRLCSRLPESMAWQMLLLSPLGLQRPVLEALIDVDPGTKALPPRLLAPYREEA